MVKYRSKFVFVEVLAVSSNVFISYSSGEYDKVIPIKKHLESEGISCWMAPDSIPGGSSYAAEIEAAIRSCDAFVLFLSESAQNSPWVTKELDRALNAGKRVLPYVMESITLNADFSFYLTNVQWYTAFADEKKALNTMTNEIIAIVEKNHGKIVKPEPEKAPAKEEKAEPEKKLAPEKVPAIEKPVAEVPAAEKKIAETPAAKPAEAPAKEEKKPEAQAVDSAPAAKPGKKAKQKKSKEKNTKKSKLLKKLLIALGVIAAVIIIIVAAVIKSSQIKIAGKTFTVSDVYISLQGVTLSDEDIEKINSYDSLFRIELIDCGLTDEQAAKINFSSVDAVILDHNQLTSLDFLAETDSIESLSVCFNSLTSLSGIEKNYKLEYLYANNNNLTSLKGLDNTTVLDTVCLANNKISDFSGLKSSSEMLKMVDISGNEAYDIEFLSNAENLETVWADNNQIKNIGPLMGKQKLENISFSHNQLSTVSIFESCPNLSYVNLSDNNISVIDIEKFNPKNPGDGVIDISNNAINDRELTLSAKVHTLDITGNRFDGIRINLSSVFEGYSNEYTDVLKAPGNNISNLYADYYPGMADDDYSGVSFLTVVGCPLNEKLAMEKAYPVAHFVDKDEFGSPVEEYRNKHMSLIGWRDKLNEAES